MLVKLYALICFLGCLAAAVVYVTGNFTPFWQILFGFLSAVAIFMGMMSVLPSTFDHRSPTKN